MRSPYAIPTNIPSLGPLINPKEAVMISIRFGLILATASAGKTAHCRTYAISMAAAVTAIRLTLINFISISPLLRLIFPGEFRLCRCDDQDFLDVAEVYCRRNIA